MGGKSVLKNSILIATLFVAAIWIIKIAEFAFGLDLYWLGVYPSTQSGLLGIATAPEIDG